MSFESNCMNIEAFPVTVRYAEMSENAYSGIRHDRLTHPYWERKTLFYLVLHKIIHDT
jgi:hypothetical protein